MPGGRESKVPSQQLRSAVPEKVLQERENKTGRDGTTRVVRPMEVTNDTCVQTNCHERSLRSKKWFEYMYRVSPPYGPSKCKHLCTSNYIAPSLRFVHTKEWEDKFLCLVVMYQKLMGIVRRRGLGQRTCSYADMCKRKMLRFYDALIPSTCTFLAITLLGYCDRSKRIK